MSLGEASFLSLPVGIVRIQASVVFSAHTQAAFLPPAYHESRSILQLPSGFPLCQHCLNLRQQRLNVCVVSFPHNKPPDVVCFPTSGGLLSLSIFTVSVRPAEPCEFRHDGVPGVAEQLFHSLRLYQRQISSIITALSQSGCIAFSPSFSDSSISVFA